ncbi:MAG TPA: winged helix-turn-helix domain-containing protein [Terriglobales bacterium]|nr:winged helix-turn-helix domain-containing protein [Terriglobales bacterium]
MDPERRLLWRDQQPIPLSPKAFDLLLALTQRGGQVVLKDDLMKMLWPDTFVEESNLGQHVFLLRKALGERPQDHTYIVTVPGRGYRFAQTVREVAKDELKEDEPEKEEAQIAIATRSLARVVIERDRKKDLRLWLATGAMLVAIMVAAGLYWRAQRKPKLTEKDTVVLADFDNKTGDPVFDGTLRQGLSAQLEQSPFLNLLSDQRTRQTLALMAQPKNSPLTPETAREVCQRTASAAVLDGLIAQIGTRYLLTLRAINCSTGESLASAEADASDKSHVLDAMGKIASEIRGKLGESLSSLQKYGVGPENVTTPSLEALKVYGLAHQAEAASLAAESVPLYERAISLDPNFAMAYLGLGITQFNLGETSHAAENVQKAYTLRERLSERERLGIERIYDAVVTGNFEAARKSELLFLQIYPHTDREFTNLAVFCTYLGDYGQSLAAAQEALKLNPVVGQHYSNLLLEYLHSGRLEDAKAIAREQEKQKLDSPSTHASLYLVEFLRHDAAAMEREASEVMGKPGTEDLVLYYESDTAAYGGHFVQARELTHRASNSALRSGQKETGAEYEAEAAVREALVGNLALAKHQAHGAVALSNGRDVSAIAALALAMAGDTAGATRMADDLSKRFPEDTALTYNLLPAIRAATALQSGDSGKAVTALAFSTPYELGQTTQEVTFVLYPVYLRGETYLAAKQGAAAATEFQKILDHPGLVQNEVIGALAHLGLGRAYVLAGDAGKARLEYQIFLSLWKDADPDMLLVKQAKSEYAKLQ